MNKELSVTLLHELPGRVRTKLSVPPADLQRFEKALVSHSGLDSVQYKYFYGYCRLTYRSYLS